MLLLLACQEGHPTPFVPRASDTDTADPDPEDTGPRADTGETGDTATTPPCTALLYADADGDTLGDPDAAVVSCEPLAGYVANALDCDDADAAEPVWASPDGVAGATGTSADPVATLAEAMDRARACVVAYPGTYAEDVGFAGRDLVVGSIEGAGTTLLVGTGQGPVVTAAAGETAAELDGFTIVGGTGVLNEVNDEVECDRDGAETCPRTVDTWVGGGVFVEAAALALRGVVVRDEVLPVYAMTSDGPHVTWTQSMGAGIYAGPGAELLLEDAEVAGNGAAYGGGLYVEAGAAVSISRSRFTANVASAGSALTVYGHATLDNTLVAGNTVDGSAGTIGGALDILGEGQAEARFVTFVDDAFFAEVYVASHARYDAEGVIHAHAPDGDSITGEAGASVRHDRSLFYGDPDDVTTCGTSVCAAPAFVAWTPDGDPAGDDYHLAPGSPAVDAGPADELDADGSPADMGCYGGPDPLP